MFIFWQIVDKENWFINTNWGRQKPLVDQDSDSQYCWSALKTDN